MDNKTDFHKNTPAANTKKNNESRKNKEAINTVKELLNDKGCL